MTIYKGQLEELLTMTTKIIKLEEALKYIAKHNTKIDGPRGIALKALYGEEGMKDSPLYIEPLVPIINKIS